MQDAQEVQTQSSTLNLLQPEKLYDSSSLERETTSDGIPIASAPGNGFGPSKHAVDSDSRTMSPTSDVDAEVKSFSLEGDGAVLSSSRESLCDDQKG